VPFYVSYEIFGQDYFWPVFYILIVIICGIYYLCSLTEERQGICIILVHYPFAIERLLSHVDFTMAKRYIQDVSEQIDRTIENSRQYVIQGNKRRGFVGLIDMIYHRTFLCRPQQQAVNRHQTNPADA